MTGGVGSGRPHAHSTVCACARPAAFPSLFFPSTPFGCGKNKPCWQGVNQKCALLARLKPIQRRGCLHLHVLLWPGSSPGGNKCGLKQATCVNSIKKPNPHALRNGDVAVQLPRLWSVLQDPFLRLHLPFSRALTRWPFKILCLLAATAVRPSVAAVCDTSFSESLLLILPPPFPIIFPWGAVSYTFFA